MNYSFEYIDIILLAMIAGFIFLRLRGILGKKTGFEEDISSSFPHEAPPVQTKTEFLKGAKIAYETIITSFSNGKLIDIKNLLSKDVHDQFEDALKERKNKSLKSETTFIGINSATIKEHQQNKNMLEVTVEFVSEIISCVKDKENKIINGDPQKIKKVHDMWKFSKDTTSSNPNWLLIDTQA